MWEYMGICGNLWESVRICGRSWERMGLYGSADVVMRCVYGALLVAMLVVCRVCAESGRV